MDRIPVSIVIVGAGFSGTLTAIHLARGGAQRQLRVTLLNPTPAFGRGLAYGSDDENLLLNVPAGNMSAFADNPEHFVSYCARIDPSISASSFVSRRLYGRYLEDTLAQTQAMNPGIIEEVMDEAVGTSRAPGSSLWQISLAGGQRIEAHHIVLATGHQGPRLPITLGLPERDHVIDPWDFCAMHRLPTDRPVVILGTGHTAVDALFCLSQSLPSRRVFMVSRHGLLPHRHRPNPQPPRSSGFPEYLAGLHPTVRNYMRALRRRSRALTAQGGDWRDVLNELRPHTSQLWRSLPPDQQARFLRHVQAHWDVHRHRLAPVAAQRLDSLLSSGLARAAAARIVSVRKQGEGIEVQMCERRTGRSHTVFASALVNCSGPNTNVSQDAHPLLVQLLQSGMICADRHRLGLKVTHEYQLLGADHRPVDRLWYVGPLLKAHHWEATAVPELRLHAQQLAQTLLARL